MPRILLGGVLGGLAMWLVGFLFWGTPLNLIAFAKADDATSQALQAALAQHLGGAGTGAYPIPWTGTAQGTQLYGQGPTAMVFFNSHGFPVFDSGALIGGLVLAVICALLLAFALRLVAAGLELRERVVLVGLVALAITAYTDLGQPVLNHMPWTYFVYLWLSDLAAWMAAGAVIAWLLPKPVAVSGA